jgi:hypothetical protein
LVAQGFTHTYEVDYLETFAPVAKMNNGRVILSLAANYNGNLHQFDVKNVFLHGELEEEIYMNVPPGCSEHTTVNTIKNDQSPIICLPTKISTNHEHTPTFS